MITKFALFLQIGVLNVCILVLIEHRAVRSKKHVRILHICVHLHDNFAISDISDVDKLMNKCFY